MISMERLKLRLKLQHLLQMIKSITNLNTNTQVPVLKTDLSNMGVVDEIILSEDSELMPELDTDLENFTDKDTSLVGAIRFARIADGIISNEDFNIALPRDRNLIRLPIRNEIVYVTEIGGTFYYELVDTYLNPSLTADLTMINTIKTFDEQTETNPSTVDDYNNTFSTGIPRNENVSDREQDETYGDIYEPIDSIHRLRLYEGDLLWEGRFGQSIRFTGIDQSNEQINPAIFIRNGENGVSQANKPTGATTIEDVNRDGSTIALTNGARIIDFIPGTVSSSGNTDFKSSPKSITNYPDVLTGDNVLISSGRLIFSSRVNETIFYSKGNIGFVSDNNLSFDLGKGIIGNIKGSVQLNTNDNDVLLNTGNGRLELGDEAPHPLVRGDELVSVLEELIDQIIQQVYATPAGPTSTGPVNQPAFRRIKTQLREILSNQNFTI